MRLLNFVWYSIAILMVLAATLVAAGRELLPRINFDNKNLVDYISTHTGADVQTTDLRCQWTQLYPEFIIRQVTVKTPELNVQLDNVRIDVDVFSSLLQKSPVFDRFRLSKANISYTAPDSANSTAPATPPDPEKIWRIINLLFNNDVQMQHVEVALHQGEKTRLLHLNDFRVEKGFTNKKVFLRLLNDQGKQNLYVVGNLEGNNLQSSEGTLYIQAENWLLNDWVTLPIPQQLTLTNGEAWLDWQGTDTANITAKLHILPQQATSDSIALPDSVDAELSAHWEKDDISVIDIHSLALQKDKKYFPLLKNTKISINTVQPELWQVQAPELTLQNLMTLNNYVPAGDVKNIFQSLNPQGYLRNVDLKWDNSKPITERMQLQANADNINSGAWNGVPAFTQVSGYLNSGISYGFIDLDSRNGFSMFYPQIYHAPMNFQRALGRVQWQWLPERQTVLVGSDYASLYGEAGEARGNFWLDIPLSNAPTEMYLAIGLRDSQAKYRDTFLPFVLPPDLLSWLKTSIGEASVPNAGFVWRGPLSQGGALSDAIQFYADINNGELQFDPAWPKLTQLNADLLVDDGTAIVRANSGLIYNTAIHGAYVEVLQQNPGLSINVNARARGSAEDGLRILKETPLKDAVGNGMDKWRAPQGALSTGLQLQIPIAGATVKSKEDVRISLFDTQLVMDDLQLDFKKINGNLNYQSDKGLSSPDISATLFNNPLKLIIASDKTAKDLTINIKAKSSINITTLADWAKLQPLKMLSGQIDYNASLKLGPFGASQPAQLGQLQFDSDLKQIALPLPPPFSKQRGESKPFNLTVDLLRDNRQNYQVEYNKQLSSFISIRNGNLLGGELVLLGDAARMPAQAGGFQIRGALPSGDLQQWLDLIAAYNKLPNSSASSNTSSKKESFYPSLALTFNNATWKNLSFPKLQISAGHENNAWRLYFDSGNARGNAFFYDTQRIPDIAVSELKIYRNKSTTSPAVSNTPTSSAENNIILADIPSLNIRIDHLLIDDMDVGSISTELRSSEKALRFEKLLATGTGYQLRDGTGTTGSTMLWKQNADGTYQSEFHGLLHMQGKQPALTQMGVDVFILGKDIYLYADLTWPGAPQDANVKTIAGNVYTEGKNGKYLQASPNAAMRALGFINIATWARRLQLDFSDLNSDGISFDEYKGKLEFNNGVMKFSEPLEINSPSSALALSGKALLNKELLDLRLIATLPVGNNATWIAALAGGLPAAAGVYLVSKVFDKQINSLTSLSYTITGPMNDPNIQFERMAPPNTAPPDEKSKSKKSAITDVTKWF